MEQIVFQGTNSDHPLVITDQYPLRNLRFTGNSRQSCINLQRPHILQLAYTRWMMSALLFCDRPKRILVLGLGGGALIHFLLHHHPQVRIDVVEKSKTVVELARKYFGIPAQSNLQIHHQDAQSFCRDTGAHSSRYDLVLIDIFDADCMAAPLFRQDFYQTLRKLLTQKGLLSTNLWGSDKEEFTRAHKALHSGCNQQSLQLKVPEKGNVIRLGFRQPLSRKILSQARRNIPQAAQQYGLPFNRYWKRLLRDNLFLFFRRTIP